MWSAILGWISLVLTVLGVAALAFGLIDFARQRGDAKMGGAVLAMISFVLLVPGLLLGIVWLAVT